MPRRQFERDGQSFKGPAMSATFYRVVLKFSDDGLGHLRTFSEFPLRQTQLPHAPVNSSGYRLPILCRHFQPPGD
ncbi:hypothetical protein SAMN04487818_10593 [Actinokineospora terrae]|uniref:Uncharacterized protein n=1 Tax=Actinokineospora terrae TaxID=155974 RepID=A0A1H9RVN4_9PSEU|nr:hypothetical protein SAMN04487818_10593 [Actinokineospora terrae]